MVFLVTLGKVARRLDLPVRMRLLYWKIVKSSWAFFPGFLVSSKIKLNKYGSSSFSFKSTITLRFFYEIARVCVCVYVSTYAISFGE